MLVLLFYICLGVVEGASVAQYSVRFESYFCDGSNFPASCPSGAHMSNLAVMVHSPASFLWRDGQMASNGVVSIAETGATTIFLAECSSNALASQCLVGGDVTGIGSTSVTVLLNDTSSRVSLISMVAPSPDWFVGADSVQLYDDVSGGWKSSLRVESRGWDAGSDGGTTYTSPNNPITPRVPVAPLTIFLVPVPPAYPAVFIFTLLSGGGGAFVLAWTLLGCIALFFILAL